MQTMTERSMLRGWYKLVARRADGTIKWVEEFSNLVTNEGMDEMLDVTLSGGTPDTTWFVGLKNTGTPVAADTLASHGSWTENTNYTGNRKAWTDAGVTSQSVTNSASAAQFAIDTDTQTITGAFLCGVDTGTAGTLFSVGDFAASKSLDSGETLDVTITISLS